MYTLLAFIITISIIVVVHELGHYFVARFFNIDIDNFSIGFGRILIRKKLKNTYFCLRAIPLGGFVSFSKVIRNKGDILFDNAKLYKRFLVVLAGPLINFIFAFFLMLIILSGTQYNISPVVTHIQKNSISEKIGIKSGDLITKINGESIKSLDDIKDKFKGKKYESLTYERGGRIISTQFPQITFNETGLFFYPNKQNSVVVKKVLDELPAKDAGIREGLIISQVNSKEILSVEQLVKLIKKSDNNLITITSLINNTYSTHQVTPITENNKTFVGMELSSLLSSEDYIKPFKYNILESIYQSFYSILKITGTIITTLKGIISGDVSINNLSGPLSIAQYSYDTINTGLISFLSFLILLNINVGLINLLPIPTLDGGHLMYYCIEFITGKRVDPKKMLIFQQLGVVFLLLLFLFAVYNDVLKFITPG